MNYTLLQGSVVSFPAIVKALAKCRIVLAKPCSQTILEGKYLIIDKLPTGNDFRTIAIIGLLLSQVGQQDIGPKKPIWLDFVWLRASLESSLWLEIITILLWQHMLKRSTPLFFLDDNRSTIAPVECVIRYPMKIFEELCDSLEKVKNHDMGTLGDMDFYRKRLSTAILSSYRHNGLITRLLLSIPNGAEGQVPAITNGQIIGMLSTASACRFVSEALSLAADGKDEWMRIAQGFETLQQQLLRLQPQDDQYLENNICWPYWAFSIAIRKFIRKGEI